MTGLGSLVDRTPVDTGRAKGGWQVGGGERPPDSLTKEHVDPDGAATKATGQAIIAAIPAFMPVFISNYVEYITALEDGHSQQAPNGMMAATLNQLMEMMT
jgi:hypothetical protein